MKTSLILRCAALLAPTGARSEWLAEWSGELAYVRRTCGRARGLAFCAGAFPDALWLRRNHTPAEARGIFNAVSSRCLAMLAALAAPCVFFAGRSSALRDPLRLRPIAMRTIWRWFRAVETRRRALRTFRSKSIGCAPTEWPARSIRSRFMRRSRHGCIPSNSCLSWRAPIYSICWAFPFPCRD